MPDTSVADQRTAFRAWLRRRDPGGEAELRETHISILGLGPDLVWKLKKAVEFPFVDLSTEARRRRQCEREVTLNRRLAPDVYLGVVALDDASGATVDHLVEMRRMPDDRRLAALATRGDAAGPCLLDVADLLARFHRGAGTGPEIDACATRDAVAQLWERNLDELAPHAGSVLDPAAVDEVAAMARRYLGGRERLFAARIAAGRARDGHGDLLADDIFCLPDGPRVLDCLEFDDHLRFGDVLGDVTFLAMDLERLGRADLARDFLDRYAERAGDAWPASLEHLYVAYRALVRAKVACLRADDGDATALDAARELLALSARHLRAGRVQVVLVGGPPGMGKTTLARTLAARLGLPALHSDEVRKKLAGVPARRHEQAAIDAGIYTPEWDARTYDALCARAREQLEMGSSVVLDASWSEPARRAEIGRVAAAASCDVVALRCRVDPRVAAARAASRASTGLDASDASETIARKLGARFADWPGATVVDTAPSPEVVVESVLAMLRAGSTG